MCNGNPALEEGGGGANGRTNGWREIGKSRKEKKKRKNVAAMRGLMSRSWDAEGHNAI